MWTSTGGPIVARRDRVARLTAGAQHVHAGVDDLRSAPAVRREADHLDTGQVTIDVEEQGRVGAVEAIDRLGRVTDEEEVVAPGNELVEQPVLHRVEVLGLVDEDMTEAPAHDVGELRIGVELAGEDEEQIVEVDDATPALDQLVVGEDLGDLRRRHTAATVRGPSSSDVVGRGDATSGGPGAFGGDRVDRAPPGDAGQ